MAEVFGKNHFDVLDKIEKLECSQEFRGRNFTVSSYQSSQNKELPMYEMTRTRESSEQKAERSVCWTGFFAKNALIIKQSIAQQAINAGPNRRTIRTKTERTFVICIGILPGKCAGTENHPQDCIAHPLKALLNALQSVWPVNTGCYYVCGRGFDSDIWEIFKLCESAQFGFRTSFQIVTMVAIWDSKFSSFFLTIPPPHPV